MVVPLNGLLILAETKFLIYKCKKNFWGHEHDFKRGFSFFFWLGIFQTIGIINNAAFRILIRLDGCTCWPGSSGMSELDRSNYSEWARAWKNILKVRSLRPLTNYWINEECSDHQWLWCIKGGIYTLDLGSVLCTSCSCAEEVNMQGEGGRVRSHYAHTQYAHTRLDNIQFTLILSCDFTFDHVSMHTHSTHESVRRTVRHAEWSALKSRHASSVPSVLELTLSRLTHVIVQSVCLHEHMSCLLLCVLLVHVHWKYSVHIQVYCGCTVCDFVCVLVTASPGGSHWDKGGKHHRQQREDAVL